MKDPDTPQEPAGSTADEIRLLEQLRANPLVAERMKLIMDRLEEEIAGGGDANQAEEMAIESLRELGQAMLTQWAGRRHDEAVEQAVEGDGQLVRHAKKTPLADDLRASRSRGARAAARAARGDPATVLTTGRSVGALLLAAAAAPHSGLRRGA